MAGEWVADRDWAEGQPTWVPMQANQSELGRMRASLRSGVLVGYGYRVKGVRILWGNHAAVQPEI